MTKMREELYPKLILILLSKASWFKLLVKSAVFENWSKLFYFSVSLKDVETELRAPS